MWNHEIYPLELFMMQRGEYCYVITIEVKLKNISSGTASTTRRGTFTVLEDATRWEVTSQIIEWAKDSIREKLSQTGSAEITDAEPTILFLSIDPN
jgi:hypothetical protein